MSGEDCWVETASSEEEALRRLKRRHYHIVLLDIVLKDKTGIDLINKIKATSENTTVVMVTGFPSAETAISSFRAGADDYLVKPVRKENLLEVIDRGIHQGKAHLEIVNVKRLNEALEAANREKTVLLKQSSRELRLMAKEINDFN